jgi:hypothetical protein
MSSQSAAPPPEAPHRQRRREDHLSVSAWLWLNFGPLVPFCLAALAIFDEPRSAKWAALAAAIAGITGGAKIPPLFNRGVTPRQPANPEDKP